MEKVNLEQLKQLLTCTWDGNLIEKTARDELYKLGLIDRLAGWNFINEKGVAKLHLMGELKA